MMFFILVAKNFFTCFVIKEYEIELGENKVLIQPTGN